MEWYGYVGASVWGILALWVFGKLAFCFRIVPQRRAYIVERLGNYLETWGPGFHILVPFFDKVAYTQDLREETMDVPPQECFTRDNVKVEVDGILYLRVTNAFNASYGITNYRYGARQLAQTTTRSVIGTLDLDQTFEERDAISSRVVSVLNEVSEAWGIQVERYEVSNIVVPDSVRNSMEQQMSAERERRAVLARAEGEKQSRINESEGTKAELVNLSEGEMQRRVNEAEGKAQEILAIAQATAESVEKMGAAMSLPGGSAAVKLQLSQDYLEKLAHLARPDKAVLLPANLGNLDTLLEGLGFDLDEFGAEGLPSAAPRPESKLHPSGAQPQKGLPVKMTPPPRKPVPMQSTVATATPSVATPASSTADRALEAEPRPTR